MAARPLLQLISNLQTRRTQARGQLQLRMRHVEAHSEKMDLPSVGNRIADFQANVARLDKSRRHPRELDELPLHRCEQYLFLQRQAGLEIIDDIRRSALCDLRAKALSRWTKNLEQGLLACEGIVELGRAALCAGSPDDQIALIHIATNSIHKSDHDFKLAGCGVQPSLRGEASRPVGGLAAPSTYPGQRVRCGARTLD